MLSAEEISQLTNTAIAHILAEPDPSLLTFSGPAGVGPSSPPLSKPYTSTAGRSDFYNIPEPVGSPAAYQQQQHPHPLTATGMGRSFSQPVPPVHNDSQMNNPRGPSSGLPSLKPVRRSFSEIRSPLSSPPGGGPGLHKMGSNMFSQFLRRKKGSGSGAGATLGRGAGGDFDESQESEDSMPPPTPPKDKGIYAPPVGMHTSEGKKGKRGKKNKAKYGHGGAQTDEFMYVSK